MNKKTIKKLLKKGDEINNTYMVQFFIGEGAFGEVYRVTHKYLGLQVMKVFKDSYVKDSDIDTVTTEAKILSKLTHPNIVRIFETNYFQKEGKTHFFMTMGFVSGETLSQLLRRKGKLTCSQAIDTQIDILKGLSAVHSHKPAIVHRDINPDNVLLSYDSEKSVALLSDFGLAQSVDQFSKLTDAAGRYAYFAPECFWNSYLPTSDVFSSAIVFYLMLTGRHPWECTTQMTYDNPEEIKTMIISARKKAPLKPSSLNTECYKELNEVVLTALDKDISKRYSNASEFLEALLEAKQLTLGKSISSDVVPTDEYKECKNAGFMVRCKGEGFDEIAGMNELKEILYYDVILPLNDKERYEKYKVAIPNGMLLYGPPGCGKTFIAQKFAKEIAYNYIELKPSDLASIYVHGTQEKIRELFTEAKENAPTIIFIDEMDALLPTREGNISHSYASEVNEFLAQMTECHKHNIFIIAATNRPEKIDPAILRTGRIDKVIYVGPPDMIARKELFKLTLSGRPVSSDIKYDKISAMTENFVASDISFIVNEASRKALKERSEISERHIEVVINNSKPSVSQKEIAKYDAFKKNRSFS